MAWKSTEFFQLLASNDSAHSYILKAKEEKMKIFPRSSKSETFLPGSIISHLPFLNNYLELKGLKASSRNTLQGHTSG
jgi:hypothetical protein